MSRRLKAIRCPADGRTMATLEADAEGVVSLVIVGGKRGDLVRDREWEDAKGRAAWLGVIDPDTGDQVAWGIPSPGNPSVVEPHRMPLTGSEALWRDPLFRAVAELPIRVACPRCHRVAGVRLSVSDGGGWDAVLA